MGKFEHGFGTQLGAAIRCCFAVAKGSFWKPDACSLEPPNNSCRRQKKTDIFSRNSEGALGSFCG